MAALSVLQRLREAAGKLLVGDLPQPGKFPGRPVFGAGAGAGAGTGAAAGTGAGQTLNASGLPASAQTPQTAAAANGLLGQLANLNPQQLQPVGQAIAAALQQVPITTFTLPLDPFLVKKLLVAANLGGQVVKHADNLDLAVAAGATNAFNLPKIPGYVFASLSPTYLESTYYSSGLIGNLAYDTSTTTPIIQSYPLTSPRKFDFGEWLVVEGGGTLTLDGTKCPKDATIWYAQEYVQMANVFYQQIWLPLMAGGPGLLEYLASAIQKAAA